MATSGYCDQCGAHVVSDDAFCGSCGAPVRLTSIHNSRTGLVDLPQDSYDEETGYYQTWDGRSSSYRQPEPVPWGPQTQTSGTSRRVALPLIVGFVVLLAAAAAVGWFLLRPKDNSTQAATDQSSSAVPVTTSETGSTGSSSVAAGGSPSSESAASPSPSSSITWASSLPASAGGSCASPGPQMGSDYGLDTSRAVNVSVSCLFAKELYDGYWQHKNPDYSASYTFAHTATSAGASGTYSVSCTPDTQAGYINCTWVRPNGVSSAVVEVILGH